MWIRFCRRTDLKLLGFAVLDRIALLTLLAPKLSRKTFDSAMCLIELK